MVHPNHWVLELLNICMSCYLLLKPPQHCHVDKDHLQAEVQNASRRGSNNGYSSIKIQPVRHLNSDYFDKNQYQDSSTNKNMLHKPEPCTCSEVTQVMSYSVWVWRLHFLWFGKVTSHSAMLAHRYLSFCCFFYHALLFCTKLTMLNVYVYFMHVCTLAHRVKPVYSDHLS